MTDDVVDDPDKAVDGLAGMALVLSLPLRLIILLLLVTAGGIAAGRPGPVVCAVVPLTTSRALLGVLAVLSVSLMFPFPTGSTIPVGRDSVSGFSSLSVFGSLLLLL